MCIEKNQILISLLEIICYTCLFVTRKVCKIGSTFNSTVRSPDFINFLCVDLDHNFRHIVIYLIKIPKVLPGYCLTHYPLCYI